MSSQIIFKSTQETESSHPPVTARRKQFKRFFFSNSMAHTKAKCVKT